MQDNTIEQYPGSSPETKAERSVPPEQDFAKNFAKGDVPPFAGEQFGVAHQGNEYYGESNTEDSEQDNSDEYNEGLSDAASLINYGLDAVAREKGVEAVVQGIKSFDASKSDNPLRDLYIHLGIDTAEELDDARDESQATKAAREHFRNEYNMPKTQQKSREGATKAILDRKELIAEVEGADPRYAELRSAARSYGKGYFEYAVKDFGLRGLTDLFSVLAEQKAQKQAKEDVQLKEATVEQPSEQPVIDQIKPEEPLEEDINPTPDQEPLVEATNSPSDQETPEPADGSESEPNQEFGQENQDDEEEKDPYKQQKNDSRNLPESQQ